ncbi:uncharacterized protein LOC129321680 isoform X2 [Prosopis cineraria]|uniref:uncharacterized protein LOC129321680 isoform X2 n=1 Tax=Prosopis cineraria TaxID=364024 RepID=UPI00240F93A5|nr:uncharacterized protein LOC129321680 isoform X2 [Prosopis cineraria]
MGKAKRWTVTYTKHIKQKRKGYQDGFLEVQDSTNKVMLYDECDKLLECRLLKNDETVNPGETLTFNCYLVDIGDQEGDSKPISDSNVDRAHKNFARRPNRLSGSNFRTPSGDSKTNVKESKERHALSPSQKIIKEFKKRELLKYKSPKISPEITKPSTPEWQVLYTSQVTQKAKKYHDGFLKLVICGSSTRQVMLFDGSRKLLDSKFLKKDDVIGPGESLAFDAYLVDVCEDQGNHEPDSNVRGKKCTDAEEIRKMHWQQSCHDTHVTGRQSEWQVIYSTRSTKKSKSYHDGFLQLEIFGSRGRQVVLCDLNKTPIERRFLMKDEVIRPGESIYFDGHFVDVGEPKESHQSPMNADEKGTGDNFVQKNIRYEHHGCLKANPIVVKGEPHSNAYLAKEANLNSLFSGSDVIKSSMMALPAKPLRDTHQILSLLQNRVAPESNVKGVGPTIDSAPSHGSYENLQDMESIETMKSSNVLPSKDSSGASGSASLQSPNNIGSPQQPDPCKEAQTNKSEAVSDFSKSSSGVHSSCSVTSEGKRNEEFSRSKDMDDCPSFGLGF